METNKFEEHIEEKLRGREIQPSETAWERISARLETSQISKTKNYFWYGIAASFVGVLIVSILFMNQVETPIDNEIVNTPTTDKEHELKKELLEKRDTEDAIKLVSEENIDSTLKSTDFDTAISEKKDVVPLKRKNPKPELNTVEGKIAANYSIEKPMVSDAIVEAKIAELLEKVVVLEQNQYALADAEVDSLLKIAQQEILADKIFDTNGALDASALLAEVEDELDQSFRNQIFEKLKKGLLKVRTAVADRNN